MVSASTLLQLVLAADPPPSARDVDPGVTDLHDPPQVWEARLQDDPDDPRLRYQAGLAYLRHGECTYALHYLENVPEGVTTQENLTARIEEAHRSCSRVRYRLKRSKHTATVLVEYRRLDRGAYASWDLEEEVLGDEVILFLSPGRWRIDLYGRAPETESTHTTDILDVDRPVNSFVEVKIPPNARPKSYLPAALTPLFVGYAVGAPIYAVGKYRLDRMDCDVDCRGAISRLQHMSTAGWGTLFAANGAFVAALLATTGRRTTIATLAAGGAFSLVGGFWVGMNIKNLADWREGTSSTRLEPQHLLSSGFLGLGLGLLTSSAVILAVTRRSRDDLSARTLRISGVIQSHFGGVGLAGRF